jgi:hypothetical protein
MGPFKNLALADYRGVSMAQAEPKGPKSNFLLAPGASGLLLHSMSGLLPTSYLTVRRLGMFLPRTE